MTTISVVIPCFNRASTIGEAIESARIQTRQPLEILVVDDASSDASAAIAEQAGARVIRMSVNKGNAAARNAGIHAAVGDVIAWLDSDDYWDANHLATVVALLDAHPDVAVANSGVRFVGVDRTPWLGDVPAGAPALMLQKAFATTIIPTMSTVVRREALLAVGGCDESERVAVDFDLWLKLAMRYKFVATREITANYRWHADQLSVAPQRQWAAMYRMRVRALQSLRDAGRAREAEELAAQLRTRWSDDVQRAWDEGRKSWLSSLVALSTVVPGLSDELRRKWSRRSRIPAPLAQLVRSIHERVSH